MLLLFVLSAPFLVGWYRDMRDFNTRLHKKNSGDGQRVFTDREMWVMRHFEFLDERISHRARPVRSVSLHLNEIYFPG